MKLSRYLPALLLLLASGSPAQSATTPTELVTFKTIAEKINPPLIQSAADGNFYGTTNEGGDYGRGSIIRITPTGTRTVVYSFQGKSDGQFPLYGLTRETAGAAYGTTPSAGNKQAGTLFSYSLANGFQRLVTFDPVNTGYPIGLLAAGGTDGVVYGIAVFRGDTNGDDQPDADGDPVEGVLYRFNSKTSSLEGLHSFPEGTPLPINGVATDQDGNLFGYMTDGTSTTQVWKYDVTTSTFTTYATVTKADLNLAGGDSPPKPIGVPVSLSTRVLRGVSANGGTGGAGAVFQVAANREVSAPASFIYGTQGQPENRRSYPQNFDAAEFNWSPAIDSADTLYGTNELGGASGHGAIWKLTKDNTLSVLNSVSDALQLNGTQSVILAADSSIFATGTTVEPKKGAFVNVSGSGGLANVLQKLSYESNGAQPNRFLARSTDGSIYGTTYYGGTNNGGLLFRIAPSGDVFTVFQFGGSSEISFPEQGLVALSDGYLYGVAQDSAGGIVWRYSPTTQLAPSVFARIPGDYSLNLPVRANTGNFFLTSHYGGVTFDGALIQITSQGVATVLTSFFYPETGYKPDGPLFIGQDGRFYGVCRYGGPNSSGTVFVTTASGGSITLLGAFQAATTGSYPVGPLVQTSNGNFYGMTSLDGGGTNGGNGALFKFVAGVGLTDVYTFNETPNGYAAQAGLILGSDGNLYGLTGRNGPGAGGSSGDYDSGGGTLFRFAPASETLTVLSSLRDRVEGSLAGSPIEQSDGSLQVAASAGGNFADGTLLRFPGIFTVLSPPVITSPDTASGKVNVQFSYQITATNSPSTFGATGLPSGLSVDAATGLIAGLPAITGAEPKSYSVVISASNSPTQTTTKTITIVIYGSSPAPVIAGGQSATGKKGVNFAYQVTATNTPTAFTATGLPAALTIDSFGIISGVPAVSGTFSAVVTATNDGGTDSKPVLITISAPPAAAPNVTLTKLPTKVTKAALKVSGTATPASGVKIASIVATLNNKKVTVKGTTKWSATVKLKKGVNTFTVYAVDSNGKQSKKATAKITFK